MTTNGNAVREEFEKWRDIHGSSIVKDHDGWLAYAAGRAAGDAEVARLQAIVSRLPLTADGVPVEPGAKVWTPGGAEWEVYCADRACEPRSYDNDPSMKISECYSTREAAALAAKDTK